MSLYDEINKFDDAYWVKYYAGSSKERNIQLEEMSPTDTRSLLDDYWRLIHKLLNVEKV